MVLASKRVLARTWALTCKPRPSPRIYSDKQGVPPDESSLVRELQKLRTSRDSLARLHVVHLNVQLLPPVNQE